MGAEGASRTAGLSGGTGGAICRAVCGAVGSAAAAVRLQGVLQAEPHTAASTARPIWR